MTFWRKKPPGRQKLVLENATSAPMQIWVEVMPDLYILNPKDKMVIESEPSPIQDHFHVIVQDGALVVYSPQGVPDQVLINGEPAEPSNQVAPQSGGG